jgi:hypothetical protein
VFLAESCSAAVPDGGSVLAEVGKDDDLPAPAPSRSASPTGRQPQNQQKNHRSNEGIYDQRDDASAKVNAELRQQPVAYKSTYQAYE